MVLHPLDMIDTLQTGFDKSGLTDFDTFLANNLAERGWIIASDYNLGSSGAVHDVYTFACFPARGGVRAVHEALVELFPADFKLTGSIAREQKKFFERGACFCFVFLVPRDLKPLRTGEQRADLARARELLRATLDAADGRYHPEEVAHLRRLCNEATKNTFSLRLLEQLLFLCSFHAFITAKIALRTPIRNVGWFPDRDNMTTFCDGAWRGLAFMMFLGLWRRERGAQPPPKIGSFDQRVPGIQSEFDPFIRVPDFLAAVFSRYDLTNRKFALPPGTKSRAGRRYKDVLISWSLENPALWIGHFLPDERGLCVGRHILARKREWLDRYGEG